MSVAETNGVIKEIRSQQEWAEEVAQTVASVMWAQMPPALRAQMRTLEDIEVGTEQCLRTIGQRFVQLVLQSEPVPKAALGACQTCHLPLQLVASDRVRQVLGLFGDYRLARAYGVCPKGHGSDAPRDRELGLGPGAVSPRLAQILSRLSIDMPFGRAATMVGEILGPSIDEELVRRVVEGVGTWAEHEEQEQIAISRQSETAGPTVPGPATMLIALDGAMVHTRRKGDMGWHEGKVGVVTRFDAVPPASPTEEVHPSYQLVDYAIGFESRGDFWPRLYYHALRVGLEDPGFL